ncbi:MAG: hypothetical protein HY718_05410 [Planctomycetes bacterium]|nr:hypothetical protein [Planctomycetota bacterium]
MSGSYFREGRLSPEQRTRLTAKFGDHLRLSHYRLLPPTPDWFDRARAVLANVGSSHPLRSLDALHLAAALLARERAPDLTLVSSDARLLVAARAVGLEALDPTAGTHGV